MSERLKGTERDRRGMAEMQKGGVIVDVVNAEQARISEAVGSVAFMALERASSDTRGEAPILTVGVTEGRYGNVFQPTHHSQSSGYSRL